MCGQGHSRGCHWLGLCLEPLLCREEGRQSILTLGLTVCRAEELFSVSLCFTLCLFLFLYFCLTA